MTDAKINSLTASKLTAGTIDASVITVTNLSATNITTGTLSFSKLGPGTVSIGAGKLELTTGYIAFGSPNTILIDYNGISMLGAGLACSGIVNFTNGIWNGANQIIDGSRNATFVSLKIGGTTTVDSSRNGLFNAVSAGGHTVADSGGQLYAQTAVQVAGVTVLGTQKADIGAPSFASFSDVQSWCAALRTT